MSFRDEEIRIYNIGVDAVAANGGRRHVDEEQDEVGRLVRQGVRVSRPRRFGLLPGAGERDDLLER